MWLVDKIKLLFYKKALAKEIEQNKDAERNILNIKDAKSIGILYNATNVQDVALINEFEDNLMNMGIEVMTMGYENKKPDKKSSDKLNIINRNDLNWFDKPVGEKVLEFKKNKFDILICAIENDCLPLEYIAGVSHATYRIGKFSESNVNHYELMINVTNNQTLPYLLKQINHFLNVINSNG
jgi:hypothetical protein